MNCPLCNLAHKILHEEHTEEPWNTKFDINTPDGTKNILLQGTLYTYKNGTETVMYKDENIIAVKSLRSFAAFTTMFTTTEHIDNGDVTIEQAFMMRQTINKYVKEKYAGHARILENQGKYATSPGHYHCHVILTKEQHLLCPGTGWNYEKYKLPIPEQDLNTILQEYTTNPEFKKYIQTKKQI